MESAELINKIKRIKFLFTDCDGVLTDNGVYYTAAGEEMKRFSIRDGMGVERLRNLSQVETGIITGEVSPSVIKRAEKLKITELYLGAKDKLSVVKTIFTKHGITGTEVGYIGDDVNDVEIMSVVGFIACPADAMNFAKEQAHYVCQASGGHGCFREVAELIIRIKGGL